MQNAKYLVDTHHMVRSDMYSYTAAGEAWINHEWLSELPFYAAWKIGALRGLYFAYTLIVETILLGLFYLTYKESQNIKGAFLVGILTVLLAVVNFGPRTILFGWGGMLILLLLLQRFRKTGDAPLWALPVLFVFWVNCHGSWLIGLIVYSLFIASGLIGGAWGKVDAVRWTPAQLKKLIMAGVAAAAALFVNPWGYRLVFYPFDLAFRQKLMVEHIDEWTSVNFHEPRGVVVLGVLLALLAMALLARERWRLDECLFTAFALYMSLTYVRFLFLAALLLAPILVRRLSFLPPYRAEIDKRLLNGLIIIAIAALLVARFPSREMLQNDMDSKFPAGALRFLTKQGAPGKMFNQYTWGGYLIWNAGLKPYIDSRADIFVYRGVLADYLDVIGMKRPLEVLDKYSIDYVLFGAKDPVSYMLRNSRTWTPVYEDSVAVIFRRTGNASETPQNRSGALP
jgi:hypothetical protein